jgi:hypothetical protein
MVSAVTIVVGIIFVIIVIMIIVGFFYLNRVRAPTPLVTDFGLTIRTPNGLYMSLENMGVTVSGRTNVNPIMALKGLPTGQTPEPTEGWQLIRPSNDPNSNIVTLFNPSNSGYIRYTVDGNGNIVGGYILVDRNTPPPDPPTAGSTGSFLGWFELSQNNVNGTSTFKSLFPGPIKGQEQYLIAGNMGQIPDNPNIVPVTIGIPSNGNNIWIVG